MWVHVTWNVEFHKMEQADEMQGWKSFYSLVWVGVVEGSLRVILNC